MTKVYCKTTDKGQQTFYVLHENKTYYLFSQDYRISNKDYFKNGLFVSEVYDFSKSSSFSVRKTLEKIQKMLPYLEQEYGIVLTKKRSRPHQKSPLGGRGCRRTATGVAQLWV